MIQSLAVLLNKIDLSQRAYQTISALNNLVNKRVDICPLIFYQDYGPYPLQPRFSTMQYIESWSFDGDLIATDLNTAKTALECPRASRRLLYMWDLEWIYNKRLSYDILSEIYLSDKIELIVRSKEHYDIVNKYWREPQYIIEDFNIEEIYNDRQDKN